MYNFQVVKLDTRGANKIAIKGIGQAVRIIDNITDESINFDTSDYVAGKYIIMFYKDD